MTRTLRITAIAALLLSMSSLVCSARAAEPRLEFRRGDHICYIGNTMADRMQHHAWLETYLHALYPNHELTFRNLGFAGDDVKSRSRSANFGSPDQWLTKCEANVVFCFFGYNEALRGEAVLGEFEKNLAEMIDGMLTQKYNGESAPRLVVFSPIAHENLRSPHLPDGSANNKNLELYTNAMKRVCDSKEVVFVDVFSPSRSLYAESEEPLTMNGIHLLEHGNRALAEVIVNSLFGRRVIETGESVLQRLREAVLDKNYYWFSRYRVVDGYNVYGERSKLAWHGQSNADVMRREMEIFDVMTANRDRGVWAVAQGSDYQVVDSNLRLLLEVKTNKPGPLDGGGYPYLVGEKAIDKMQIAEGMQVNLFASEEMFPRLINPVQMAVDTDSRLWASVWPSYPHWNPTEERNDALVILPDENRDGVADECILFADNLNSVTGFEFWGGGVLVFVPPELWFLKDTDGDDRADMKIRMLQGVSSADTHHSANAVLVGPDGWLYWSRGVFNVASFETPTKRYRSGQTGVHRFNPRTFEVEFHFPIGPNPHGDVFDQWGYQFANEGTSGTGCYVNIGKGVGNKQWFPKRVRPVPATGILSSSHFPERCNGNFLICNAVGFLGVLQHEVKYNGADITAEEIEPIVVSSDQNFRPSDLEIGGDGALYISDWHNALIGHMQHNMRDPSRDHTHGRIYRVTHKGRELLTPVKMKGQPIEQVCNHFFSQENGTRYRARLELSARDTGDVVEKVGSFASRLDPGQASKHRDQAQALLECLWVFEEHRVPNGELLERVFQAEEPRVRAAAIRTLGHWGVKVKQWESVLISAARDDSGLVRAEAAKAAVSFDGLSSAEVIFEVAKRPTDPELVAVLNYARGKINVEMVVQNALNSGQKLSVTAQTYVLHNAKIEELLKMEPAKAVYRAILDRKNASTNQLNNALSGLSRIQETSKLSLLMQLIGAQEAKQQSESLAGLGKLLVRIPAADLRGVRNRLQHMATHGKSASTRRIGYSAWITADGSADEAFEVASADRGGLRDLLNAIPQIPSSDIRGGLFAKVRPLLTGLPPHLKGQGNGSSLDGSGIRVDYFEPNPKDVAIETLAKLNPKASGVVSEINMDVPQLQRRDEFALRFTGAIHIDRPGEYIFYTTSDDGSRLYVGDDLVVDNDGRHGMAEKSGSLDLPTGMHPVVVTYFDGGGGDGLAVSWAGPGFAKQRIPGSKLTTGDVTLHDVAIGTLASIPGHEIEKFHVLASLIKQGKHLASAVHAIRQIPQQHWPQDEFSALVFSLAAHIAEVPARYRTRKLALDAMQLGDTLASKLPADQARVLQVKLADLKIAVIPIGTVPHRMIYDKERLAVQSGKSVEFVFSNTDNMPHNFAIVQPGGLEEIGLLAESTARDEDAMARHYIPRSDKVLLGSRLLQPGEIQALSYQAPTEPGIYPYVCTYPGHWRRMYGALYVVADLKTYLADPNEYLLKNPLPLHDELLKYNERNTEWMFEDLLTSIKPLSHDRSFDVSMNVFKVANCVACHRMNDEGQVFGPDLTKLEPKKHTTEHILRAVLEPSKDIEEKYQTYSFVLNTGKVVTGMIVEETPKQVKIIVDPIAKATPVVIAKDLIDDREKQTVSIMPKGLMNKLSREEVLDLIAYVFARGDKNHKLFAGAHKH